MRLLRFLCAAGIVGTGSTWGGYVNFESSHVHPLTLTPTAQDRLLVVNTPDALLEVFSVQPDGRLEPERSIAVGLEPVTVRARTDTEAWVVNNLSDTISIVDLVDGVVTRTLSVGDEPTDVVFANSRAFVSVSQQDVVKVFALSDLGAPPSLVPLLGRDVRALASSASGNRVYAVTLRSGNRTSVVNANVIFGPNNSNLNAARLNALGLRDLNCSGMPPLYPDLPPGIARNPALTDPPPSANPLNFPPVGLIVRWNPGTARWEDEDGANWNDCLPYRLPDSDLFIINTSSLAVTAVAGVGTALFDVSVHPNGKIYVSNTDSRNSVRFEHPLGVRGHVVDNRLSVIDPGAGNSVTIIDLNTHINRSSDPSTNLAERSASVSQPGMLVWNGAGSVGYLTAIGSRKLFRVDGTCLAGSCIFGPNRAAPNTVEVGEGPSGVALLEGKDRLYVLDRIDHTLATVEASTLSLLEQRALHDPSSEATRAGRRFLYDGIDTSGHGDAACASCHLFGDLDGLSWDLGDPTGTMVPYSDPLDNVRFVVPNGVPTECNPNFCAAHDGFDPQKGPTATQTLRGMLEPLHWRGDRATMNDFNMAFVNLMGTADVGPIAGKPAGLSVEAMERFRQFALELRFSPNPFRNVDDTTPCGTRSEEPGCEVTPHGSLLAGNPTEGSVLFDTHVSDAGQTCAACHAHPFGAAGGKLGGVAPTEPTSPDAAALFFGTADGSPHSDLKIPHLRNLYDKFGPVWAAPAGAPPNTGSGFGFTHDGSVPDLFRFLSSNVFTLSDANQAQQVRDLAVFLFHFPTGTKPAVGQQLTVPPGAPPTGSSAEESLLTTLIGLGDLMDGTRDCELVATTIASGRPQSYHLSGGLWVGDASADAPLSTADLRQGAQEAITFTCATLGSGPRLGGDRDEDQVRNFDDCAPADGGSFARPVVVTDVQVDAPSPTVLSWSDQSTTAGADVRYDVLGDTLSSLRATGFAGTTCVGSNVAGATFADLRPHPAPGEGYYYLVRAENSCGDGGVGAARDGLVTVTCDP